MSTRDRIITVLLFAAQGAVFAAGAWWVQR
jgi:hypothetical protein